MKARANKKVNIRTNRPYLDGDSNLKGEINPGFEIEVVEEVEGQNHTETVGDTEITSSKWYKDKNGDYYWSGGFEETPDHQTEHKKNSRDFTTYIKNSFNIEDNSLIKQINYNEELVLDNTIKNTLGENISVGILDYPIKKWGHVFDSRIIEDDFKVDRINGSHGTLMASLIASNKSSNNNLTGIAPKCQILQLPILYSNQEKHLKLSDIKDFIYRKFPNGNIIINISLAYSDDEQTDEIVEFYTELASKYTLVASAGENEQLLNNQKLQFPSSLDNVISVGTLNQDLILNIENSQLNEDLDFIIKGFQYVGVTRNEKKFYDLVANDSSATAIVTGTLALLASYIGDSFFTFSKDKVLKTMYPYCISLHQAKTDNKLKIINPKL